jgi:hypothetical protein
MRTILKNFLLILFASISFAQPKYFDPNGYYSPSKSLKIAGAQLEWFEVNTLDYFGNGELNYDNPKFKEPEILVSFSNLRGLYSAKNIIITRDTIAFTVELPSGMIMTFNGNFLDRRGQFWDQKDIIPQKTPVLACIISVNDNDKLKESKKVKFTYSEGD